MCTPMAETSKGRCVRTRFTGTTMSDDDQPVAANLLDRQFTAEAPNRRWVGDRIKVVVGASGKRSLAAILDLCSRFAVGWALSAVDDRNLTTTESGQAQTAVNLKLFSR